MMTSTMRGLRALVFVFVVAVIAAVIASAAGSFVDIAARPRPDADLAARDEALAWASRAFLILALVWIAIGAIATRTTLVRRPGAAAARATWLASTRCQGVTAASSYYGRRIPELIDKTPRCPIILHFGKKDASIPMAQVEAIRDKHPDIPIYLYDAGHGFASDRRDDYDHDSFRLARLRTLKLFARPTGSGGEA